MTKHFVLILVAIQFIFAGATQAVDSARPNIILIYTDDQGFGDVSCLNPEAKFQTPSLDRVAREGISFTDAHCSDTVCTPSRYGLLTGRYSWRTTLKRGVFGAEKACLIGSGRMTLASLLKENGYHTGIVGKWHLGMDFPGEMGNRDWSQPVRDMPLDKGFDYFYGIPASMNYGVLAWFEGRYAKVPPTLFTAKKPNDMAMADYRIMPPYESTPELVKEKLDKAGMEVAADFVDSECLTRFTDKAIEWLQGKLADSRDGKPFFLYLPYTSPHKPVIPLPEFRGRGQAGAYGEFIIETDHHVGRILRFLDESSLTGNTLLIITSDNGPETTWKQRIVRFQHDSSGIYREGKRSIYEGGHRVPFLVRWPQGIREPGRKWKLPICQTDVLATIAEMLGQTLPDDAGEDSQSFLGALKDPSYDRARLPMVHHAANGRFAVRIGAWKLVLQHQQRSAELYDLVTDPGESENVIEQHPDIAETMGQRITDVVCSGRTTPGKAQLNDTAYWRDLGWIQPTDYQRRAGGN